MNIDDIALSHNEKTPAGAGVYVANEDDGARTRNLRRDRPVL